MDLVSNWKIIFEREIVKEAKKLLETKTKRKQKQKKKKKKKKMHVKNRYTVRAYCPERVA